ncbi:enoyl-CoA hydratase/isomerase family protein [candidate division WOR-3 bacterium]|nr:enoyl-CoA hydratase/isomerase family protein [candidate division WOR-3 bacterium]
MKFIDVECREGIGIVRLTRDVTNAINLKLVNELSNRIRIIKEDVGISGVVLTSANDKFFSIGFDIPELIKLSKDAFKEFYHSFNQLCIELYTFPKPVIAAIIGHAVAGGCILTICCDYRYIAEGRNLMGLNEIKLGVPLPYPADCILRQIVDDRAARIVLDTGDFFPPDETLKMGLVDEVIPLDQVVARSIEKVKSITALSSSAFEMIKRNRTEKVETQIRSSLLDKEKIFIEMWYSAETRRKLEAALEKF